MWKKHIGCIQSAYTNNTTHSQTTPHRGLDVEHNRDGARVVPLTPTAHPPTAQPPPPPLALPPNMPAPPPAARAAPVRTQSQQYTPFDEPGIMPGPSVDYRPTFASPGAGVMYYHAGGGAGEQPGMWWCVCGVVLCKGGWV